MFMVDKKIIIEKRSKKKKEESRFLETNYDRIN